MAFTLSETLIALVIIGIVAAITIPSISKASEKYILKNQFKKTYSTLLNAMNKADADLGGRTLCYYYPQITGPHENADCRAFFTQMFKNLSIQKVCDGNAKSGGCIPTPYMKEYISNAAVSNFFQDGIENNDTVYNLADGTIVILYGKTNYAPLYIVDINGAKGPNEFSKDIYTFLITSDGENGLKITNNVLIYMPRKYFNYASEIFKE